MDDAAGGGTSGVDGHAEGVGGQVGSLGRIDGPANHAPGPDAGDDAAVHLSLTPQEADLLRSLDRGLHGLYRSRRAARGVRGVPDRRCDWRNLARGTAPALSAWSRRTGSRSAGCRWLASFSATRSGLRA